MLDPTARMRFLLVVTGAIATMMVFGGCNTGSEAPADPPRLVGGDPDDPADQLASRLRLAAPRDPGALIALASEDAPPLPVKTLAQVKADLSANEAARPVLEALRAAGHTDEEAAVMITVAGAYNSGTAADPAHQRREEARARFRTELAALDSAISGAERETGVKVDRARLFNRMFSFGQGSYGGATAQPR
jgi:hypothetical protein